MNDRVYDVEEQLVNKVDVNISKFTLPINSYWRGTASTFGTGQLTYVAVGGNDMPISKSGWAAYSTDGKTWNLTSLPLTESWMAIGSTNWVAVALAYNSNKSVYSTDGITWKEVTLPISGRWNSLAWAQMTGGYACLVATETQVTSNTIAFTKDGTSWSTVTLPMSGQWISSGTDDVGFYMLDYNTGTVIRSKYVDQVSSSWEIIETGLSRYTDLKYNQTLKKYVITDQSRGGVYPKCSVDLKNWEIGYGDTDEGGAMREVYSFGGRFVCHATYDKKIFYSTDGIYWKKNNTPFILSPFVSHGNSYIAFNREYSDEVYLSDDAINWRDSDVTFYLHDLDVTDTIKASLK